MVVLLSRPGAYFASKSLMLGCETGLRIRRSNIMNDMYIEHRTKSGGALREKLHMDYHNVFESYTEQNIFRCMKDLFSLQELVLQDNINQLSKNIFMDDEEDHVFMAQNNEVK
jgi:hypothetical protein